MEATTGHQVPRQMNETGWLLKFFYGVVEFFFFSVGFLQGSEGYGARCSG